MEPSFLGELLPKEFLNIYWNKKPLLVKHAIKNPQEYAAVEDFIEMSKDEYFETRIVYEKGGEYPWQAKNGPLTDEDFRSDALWTLICHNLELLNSDFFELKKNVRFIPDWNFDDIMATISKKGASVGAHVDDYSVFIIQGMGSRKWLLQENPNPEYLPNLDIKLLKEFHPDIEWILEPGDMIYIPPNVAHHGISLEDSISYSLGFKSIRYKDILDHHITQVIVNVDEASFHDKAICAQSDSFLLQDYVVENIYNDLLKFMDDKVIFKNSLLMYLSRPKNIIENNVDITPENVHKELAALSPFKRDVWAKMVSNRLASKQFQVSINSNVFKVSIETYQKLSQYFLKEADETSKLAKSDLENIELIHLMALLIQNGVFYFV